MINEEFQSLMLSELKKINQRFDSVDSRFDTIETKIDQIETRLDSMDAKIDQIEIRLDSMDTKIYQIETRLDSMDAKIDRIESQQRENTDFIQALLHQTEELSAKYDGLLNITVSKENVLKLEKKIDTLAYRIIEQDNDISFLRRAK